jgi:catechol 2,3-dioxygenase-like lactoylglutathione lyase family enzyme
MILMPPVYTYDHIHLRTKNPQATIEYYQQMFDATPVSYVQSNGKPRVDLDLNGLTIFIAEVPADATLPAAPSEPYIGLDHLGLRVDDVDAAVAELKRRGAQVIVEPRTIRPGVRIAFIQGPDDVRIELLERTVIEVSEAAGR